MSQGFSLDVSYDGVADRLKLVLRDGSAAVGFLMTRRLVKGLLENLAGMIERTAASANSDGRAAAVFEHLDAVGSSVGGGSSGGGGGSARKSKSGTGGGEREKPVPETWSLASKVNLRVGDDRLHLTITDTDDRDRRISLTRQQAHRVLSAFVRKSQIAGWDLDPYLGWLAEAGAARHHGQERTTQAH